MGYEETYKLLMIYYSECMDYWCETKSFKEAYRLTLLDIQDAHTDPYTLKNSRTLDIHAKKDLILWLQQRSRTSLPHELPLIISAIHTSA